MDTHRREHHRRDRLGTLTNSGKPWFLESEILEITQSAQIAAQRVAPRLGNSHDREDLIQETQLGVDRALTRPDFRPRKCWKAYAYGIAYHALLDHYKKNKNRAQIEFLDSPDQLSDLTADPQNVQLRELTEHLEQRLKLDPVAVFLTIQRGIHRNDWNFISARLEKELRIALSASALRTRWYRLKSKLREAFAA